MDTTYYAKTPIIVNFIHLKAFDDTVYELPPFWSENFIL